MELTILLQTVRDVADILSIENVSIIGVLLLVIIGLIWDKVRVEKRHEKEQADLRDKIVKGQERLDEEYSKSNAEIKGIIEKYYTMSTRVLETLNSKL